MSEEFIEETRSGPRRHARTLFVLQTLLVALVVGWVLDLQRSLFGLNLYTEQLLLAVLGGLYVVETLSVILQVASFRFLHRRVFKMAPIHLHFELSEWPEFTVIVRFWILAGLAVAFGLGLFYAEFLAAGGTGG